RVWSCWVCSCSILISATSCRCSLLAAAAGAASAAPSAKTRTAVVNLWVIFLFCRDHEVGAPVLCVSRFIVGGVERELLAVAHGAKPVRGDAQRDEIRSSGD